MGDMQKQLLGNRYELLEELGAGGMGAVFRAYDRLQFQQVALKRVRLGVEELAITLALGKSTTYSQVALAREFQMLASLRHPNIISVLDYGFDEERQPFFTMTLLEKAEPITKAGFGKDRPVQIRLLIELLQALSYLHHRGIVHRDLKPDNALVDAEGLVRVLDFGISARIEDILTEDEEAFSGTIAYTAPEVMQGGHPSEASDLYAVGLIAYQIFAGKHPYASDTFGEYMHHAQHTQVDVRGLGLGDAISAVLERLLSKSPADRYANAQEPIALLSQAIGEAIPAETTAIRESFLQAARFVGRDKEMNQLLSMLTQAETGKGTACLVGGESGVGKSRLLDELRTQALVKGALVLRGQSVAEGGFVYHIWRDPVRRLLLSVPVSDLEASVLKQIVPDIDKLLDRTVSDTPELEGRAGQQRLISTIVELFRKQKQFTVLILEDLHWAVESLDVLNALIKIAPELHLLIIGNYRNDEKPDLPTALPGMEVLRLERLSHAAISELTVSMLGPQGSQPQVLELLERETEGNVYFLVEVVRTLAEEAGRLSEIGHMTLPRQVLAGGIEQIVQRRLSRVPEAYRTQLRLAAVAGRQLDLRLLMAVDPSMSLDAWLAGCTDAGVIELMNEEWRFTHDKLRENLLRSLDPGTRQWLHRQVAETLARIYANSANQYAAMISDHYEQAGNFAEAVRWYTRAGQHAQASYALEGAVNSYRKALALWDQAGNALKGSTALRLEIDAGLGEMLNWQTRYDEAEALFTTMKTDAEAASDLKYQERAWRGIASARMNMGNFPGALETLGQAEAIGRKLGADALVSRTLMLQGWCRFYLGEIDTALTLGKQALELSEKLEDRLPAALTLNLLTAIHGTLGRFDEAAQECQRALTMFQQIGARDHAMFQVGNLGQIEIKRGAPQSALAHFEDALARARQLGRRDAEMLYLNNVGGAQVQLGRLDEAEANLTQVITMSEQSRFRQISETYVYLAEVKLRQGNIRKALEAGAQGLELAQAAHADEVIVMAWRVLGQVAARFPTPILLSASKDEKRSPHTAERCFAESERIAREAGMEADQAVTLRAWATYDLEQGDAEKGKARWEQAREIFTRLGATPELAAMETLPKHRA